jgi:nucleotide-binding universal stress UspA family protein
MDVSLEINMDVKDETDNGQGEAFIRHLKQALAREGGGRANPGPTPWLLLRQPRWPLREILLVLRGDERDRAAAAWAVCLARSCHACVTLLVIYPDIPSFYSRNPNVQLDLPVLLQVEEGIGGHLRQILCLFHQNHIPCEIHIRKAEPDEQLRLEMAEGQPDFVILSHEEHGRLWRWYFGELIQPLLGWVDRPVLVI